VLYIYEGSQVLAWTAVDSSARFEQGIPSLFVQAGEGLFEGAVRFRNPVTDLCVSNEYAYGRVVQCDPNDPLQASTRPTLAGMMELISGLLVLHRSARRRLWKTLADNLAYDDSRDYPFLHQQGRMSDRLPRRTYRHHSLS
jgi:hypothetical protein